MASSDPTSSHTDTQTPPTETESTDKTEDVTAASADAGTAESSNKESVEEIKKTTDREDRDATPPLESPGDVTEKPADKSSDSESAVPIPTETETSEKTSDSKSENTPVDTVTPDAKSNPEPATKAPSKPWYLPRSYSTPIETREHFENMPLDRKRKLYKCGKRYQQLKDIDTWPVFSAAQKCSSRYKLKLLTPEPAINSKVSLWRGDITSLEIDAIVNAANRTLLGGGGVDGAIHDAAGRSLHKECYELNGCDTGESKLSGGHKLPAKYIIHTVGPMGEHEDLLTSCYDSCLRLVEQNSIKSIAFCCISTGIYGYPNLRAARTALQVVRHWFETSEYAKAEMERVIFCVFLKVDFQIYSELMCNFFPVPVAPIPDTTETGDKEGTPPVEDRDPVTPQAPTDVPRLTSAVTAPAALLTEQLAPAPKGDKGEAAKTECLETTHGMSEEVGEGGAIASEIERIEPSAKLPKLEGEEAVTESAEKDKPTEHMEDKDTQDPTTDTIPTAGEEKNI